MNSQQAIYLMNESVRTLGRHKGVMALSVIIMSLTLLILAVFLLATDNMLILLDRTRQELRVYVYLEDGLSQETVEQRYRQLLLLPEVESIIHISKSEALEQFREDLGEERHVLDALEANPLPESFRVKLKPEFRDKENTAAIAKQMSVLGGIEEVNYGKDFLERFSLMTQVFFYIDIVLGFIVILSSVFIISNTVRLTILSRLKSIEILKLVGATNRFITAPFIMEGAFQGALASIVS